MISVAMATYNGEKYLSQQIDSILNQTYKDIEIVICDDCSKDKTREILTEYAQKDSRIKVFFNEHNLGFKKNFEKAIFLCSGEYIALSDQDDIWVLNKLQTLLSEIKDYDIVCSNSEFIDENNERIGNNMLKNMLLTYIPEQRFDQFKRCIHSNFVQGSTMMAKKAFFKKVLPIPEFIKYHDEWFSVMAGLENGIKYIYDSLLLYRTHTMQVTDNSSKNFTKDLFNTKYVNLNDYFIQRAELCSLLLENYSTDEKTKSWLESTKKYFEHMQNKDFYTYKYFLANYDILYLDKSISKKILRCIKRFLGLLKYKLLKK